MGLYYKYVFFSHKNWITFVTVWTTIKWVTFITTILLLIIRSMQIMLTAGFNAFLFDFNGFITKNKVMIKKVIILSRSQIDLHTVMIQAKVQSQIFFFTSP